jgi:hypothetical protein
MSRYRVPTLAAALGLLLMVMPFTASLVFAWTPPLITSNCTSDQSVHNWTITLTHESNYSIQWANNSSFSGATTVTMHYGANSLTTPASVTTLYVRWTSDHNSKNHATWNGGICPTASPTSYQSFGGATGTPTDPPKSTPTPTETEDEPTATPTPTSTDDLNNGPSDSPTGTPYQSFQGETSNPTPPSTSSGDQQGSSPSPMGLVLVSLAFGLLGLAAIQIQKLNPRRQGVTHR